MGWISFHNLGIVLRKTLPFCDVVDAADGLSIDEQGAFIDILRRRLAECGRQRLASDVKEGRPEFAQGNARATTLDELMKEIDD